MANETATSERPYRPDLLPGPWGPRPQWEDAEGVPLAMHYITGFFTSDDGGRRWMAMRSTLGGKARKLTLLEMGPDGDYRGAPLQADAYAGPLAQDCRDGVWGDWRPDGSPLIQTTETTVGWHEGGLLDATGTQIGGPPRFFVPDAEFPLIYTLRWFAMNGTIDDEPVSGAAAFGSVHLPAGRQLIPSPYTGEAQVAWTEFCNEFEDGTTECGLLLFGRKGFATLNVQRSDGSMLTATEVSAEAENDGGVPEFPARVRYSGDGEVWVAEALPKGGRWPLRTELPDEHRLMQVTVRRAGEDRPVRRSSGMIETYQQRF